ARPGAAIPDQHVGGALSDRTRFEPKPSRGTSDNLGSPPLRSLTALSCVDGSPQGTSRLSFGARRSWRLGTPQGRRLTNPACSSSVRLQPFLGQGIDSLRHERVGCSKSPVIGEVTHGAFGCVDSIAENPRRKRPTRRAPSVQ